MKYLYVREGLLEQPQNYQYSEFIGVEFIDAWKMQRANLKEQIYERYDSDRLQSVSWMNLDGKELSSMYTFNFLSSIIKIMHDDVDGIDLDSKLRPWLKTFEVRKRLYEEYDDNMNPVIGSTYSSPSLYLLFACMMEEAWSKLKELPFLNVLLKVMDTLSSIVEYMNQDQQAVFYHLILREEKHVMKMGEKLSLMI